MYHHGDRVEAGGLFMNLEGEKSRELPLPRLDRAQAQKQIGGAVEERSE